jgi:hypothetical protein
LEKLAERILDELAADKSASREQQIDALKAVAAYHLGVARVSGKNAESDDGGPSFRDWAARAKERRADA